MLYTTAEEMFSKPPVLTFDAAGVSYRRRETELHYIISFVYPYVTKSHEEYRGLTGDVLTTGVSQSNRGIIFDGYIKSVVQRRHLEQFIGCCTNYHGSYTDDICGSAVFEIFLERILPILDLLVPNFVQFLQHQILVDQWQYDAVTMVSDLILSGSSDASDNFESD